MYLYIQFFNKKIDKNLRHFLLSIEALSKTGSNSQCLQTSNHVGYCAIVMNDPTHQLVSNRLKYLAYRQDDDDNYERERERERENFSLSHQIHNYYH